MSVDLEELLSGDRLPIDALYGSLKRSVGAVAVSVREASALGLTVEHQPVCRNWYHGGVSGIDNDKKKKLAQAAELVIEIDQAAARQYDQDRRAAAALKAAAKPPDF